MPPGCANCSRATRASPSPSISRTSHSSTARQCSFWPEWRPTGSESSTARATCAPGSPQREIAHQRGVREMATLTETKARPERKPLPPPNSDFYQLAETLQPAELALVKQVRAFMDSKVAPIATKYWADDAFPFELLPAFKELNVGGVGMQGYGCRGGS